MNRSFFMFILLLCIGTEARAHNVGNAITWNREISRIMYSRCVSCHHEGGSSFSLMKYQDVQPRAVEIKESMLSRRMPPWGAVKGFGDFRDEQGLSQAELELITDWVDSDTPKGNNPNVLPKEPKFDKPPVFKLPKNANVVTGDFTLPHEMSIAGLFPVKAPPMVSVKIMAFLPDGEIRPLLWLYEYDNRYQHPFVYRQAVELPAGTIIRGVPRDAEIALLPGKKSKASKAVVR